jgi:malate dehydrogenase (oxaloacetate-decarboxylating)
MADPLLRTLRCRNDHRPGVLGRLATAIGSAGTNIGDIRTVWVGPDHIVRDLDVLVDDAATLAKTLAVVNELDGVEVIDVIDDVHEFHIDGKLEVRPTHPVQSIHDLRRVYTPGVAEVVRTIVRDPDESYTYTIRGKTVAIVTNGTRVLGLGNVGPVASLPVMEGKAALLHQFVGISAFPIVLDTRDADAIVETVQRIAPGSRVSSTIGKAEIPTNWWRSAALPSITGSEATGPTLPSPRTRVPFVTIATVLPRIV